MNKAVTPWEDPVPTTKSCAGHSPSESRASGQALVGYVIRRYAVTATPTLRNSASSKTSLATTQSTDMSSTSSSLPAGTMNPSRISTRSSAGAACEGVVHAAVSRPDTQRATTGRLLRGLRCQLEWSIIFASDPWGPELLNPDEYSRLSSALDSKGS